MARKLITINNCLVLCALVNLNHLTTQAHNKNPTQMKNVFILLFLVSLNITAQNAKNKGLYVQELHYPEIILPTEFKTYKFITNVNNETIKRFINTEQTETTFKNPDITGDLNRQIKLPGYEVSETPDFILEFTDLGVKHFLSVKEKKGRGSNAQNTYTGIVEVSSTIKLVVKDTKGNILLDKLYTDKYKTESASVFKNFSIKSSAIALSQIKKQYNANIKEYRYDKNTSAVSTVVSRIATDLKTKFSSYYESQRVNLFLIKKEEKYGMDTNAQVEKLIAFSTNKYNDDYTKNLNALAKESLAKFESELLKITDKTDKKQKKMYWSLLSNISGVYYALGNFDKAIEYAKLRQEIDYNKKWRFNLEIAEKRKAIVEKNKV